MSPAIDFLWPTYSPPSADLDRMLEAMRGGVRSILTMMAKNRHVVNIQQIGCKLLLNIDMHSLIKNFHLAERPNLTGAPFNDVSYAM